VILAALVIQLALLFVGGVDANSGESGDAVGLGTRLWRLFSFFTIQSNLIVLAVAVVLLLRPSYDNRFWRTLRLDSLLGIVITGLVFAIVLAPQIHLTGWGLAATIGFHYISPWTTLAAWLVFGPRPRLTWSIVAAAFIWPLGWLIYTFTQGAFTDWYPYPFLDVTDRGFGHAVRNAALVLVIGVVLATILKLVDAKLPVAGRRAGGAEEDGFRDVFLADRAADIYLIDLEGPHDGLSINGANVLAFEPTLSWDIQRVQGVGMLSNAGLFNCAFSGQGRLAITCKGTPVVLSVDQPTFADPQAAVCWSTSLQTGYQRADQIGLGTLLGRTTGEAFTMNFAGQGFVVVQPSEEHQAGSSPAPAAATRPARRAESPACWAVYSAAANNSQISQADCWRRAAVSASRPFTGTSIPTGSASRSAIRNTHAAR
jgi:uncharacterized protein (AIM24 family)